MSTTNIIILGGGISVIHLKIWENKSQTICMARCHVMEMVKIVVFLVILVDQSFIASL